MRVHLEPFEYEWAAHVGIRRLTARTDSKNAAHYDERRMQDELRSSIASCCCELAVAKAANRYWAGHVWDARDHAKFKALADVGTNIEVRRVREQGSPFAVRRRDVTAGRVMFAAHPIPPVFSDVIVYGYLSAADAWERGTPAHYDRHDTRVCELGYLTPVEPKKETRP